MSIFLPALAFSVIEDWTMLDSIYYSLISLTTIGIGDFVPSVLPPTKFAKDGKQYNNSACFEALINPIPEEGSQNNVTKFPKKCDPVRQKIISEKIHSKTMIFG